MKKMLFPAVSLLLFLGSCSQNDGGENVLSKERDVVVATIEGQPESRLSVSHDEEADIFSLAWSDGDSFKVFDENGSAASYDWSSGLDFIVGDNQTPLAAPKYAVYPNLEENELAVSGSEVSMKLNATPSIGNVSLPMWADAAGAATGTFEFRHLAAALQFTLDNIPEGYNSLIVEASVAISGEFKADLSDAVPVLSSASTDEADKRVTVAFTAPTGTDHSRVFHIPLPVNTYESLKVSVSNGEDTKDLKKWTDLKVVRGRMYYTTAAVDASTVDAVNSALANAGDTPTTLNLTAAIDASTGEIEIPGEAKDVTLDFGEAPVTTAVNPLVISQNGMAESGVATGGLTVIMPSGATGLCARIHAPAATVTLTGGSYTALEAITAENTLVVGEGVTIGTLTVKGGNVRVDGGTIGTIERSSDNADAVTLVYYAGTVPSQSNSDSRIIYLSADAAGAFVKCSEKTYHVNSVEGLKIFRDAVNNKNTFEGYTVRLTDDVDLGDEQWIPIGYWETFEGIFDGDGHTVSNLKHHATELDCYIGLFGCTDNATIRNLTIHNADIKLVGDNSWAGGHIGAFVGYPGGTSVLQNISLTGRVRIEGAVDMLGGQRIGAVVGGFECSSLQLSDVVVNVDSESYVKGNLYVGGVAGSPLGATTMVNVTSNIDVYSKSGIVGGIMGYAQQGSTLTNCSSSGNVTRMETASDATENQWVRIGGIIGSWGGTSGVVTLKSCSYTGSLSCKDNAGNDVTVFLNDGLVGGKYFEGEDNGTGRLVIE